MSFKSAPVERPCLDIVRPFVEALDDCYITDVQMFGGIGSAALEHPEVGINLDSATITVPKGALDNLRRLRQDGTLRDLDCLVLSTDDGEIGDIEELATSAITKGQLALSFFGLQPISRLAEQRAHPVASLATVHLSDRYVREEGGRVVEAKKALFPFVVDMPTETLQTWRLDVGGEAVPIPVPHPGTTVLNYLTRSVSGLRPKDTTKVNRLLGNVAQVEPGIVEWIKNGPGASQFDFARVMHTLRSPHGNAQPLVVGDVLEVEPYSLDELAHHRAFGDFMQRGRPGLLKLLIGAEHVKSRGLHFAERQERIVTAWQGHIESHAQGIIKNK